MSTVEGLKSYISKSSIVPFRCFHSSSHDSKTRSEQGIVSKSLNHLIKVYVSQKTKQVTAKKKNPTKNNNNNNNNNKNTHTHNKKQKTKQNKTTTTTTPPPPSPKQNKTEHWDILRHPVLVFTLHCSGCCCCCCCCCCCFPHRRPPRWPSGEGVRLGSGRSRVRIPLAKNKQQPHCSLCS